MKTIVAITILLTALPLFAGDKQENASSMFLHAYIVTQRAESLAQKGEVTEAVKNYNEAAEIFSDIRRQYPDWQPQLVEYRKARITRAISQPQSKLFLGTPQGTPLKWRPHWSSSRIVITLDLLTVGLLSFWLFYRYYASYEHNRFA